MPPQPIGNQSVGTLVTTSVKKMRREPRCLFGSETLADGSDEML